MKTSSPENRLPLVVVLGPTAVGKTEVAIQLAEQFQGEIVSADSRLFYRGMDIGTAKPGVEQRRRVPHHLIDVAQPDEILSLTHFQEQARQVIHGICARQKLPFLVGGTGQYVRAVLEGWQAPEVAPNPRLRQALEDWAQVLGQDGLHARLTVLDPQAAQQIDARNVRRSIRALEVILSTGKPFSAQRRRGESPYDLLLLGLIRPREELYARIDARIETMFEDGLVGEVQGLLDQGYSPTLPSLSAIGYREVIRYLQGEIDLEEAKVLIRRATRTYVRRQANWFKTDDPQITWFQVDERIIPQMAEKIHNWLITRQNPS
ncbi:MAG TPA: tRNA (adenosine(37)-N6)-dimethylallyltransferase MiaA [Anaerolineales bacterium]|nr:tRNA (adenosine(37)-N6)-dimethylallyltransferase MiaA [Anaerolineales bacterium]